MKRINSEDRRELRQNLCNAAGGACAYCHRVVGMRGTVDHYLPEALGGTNAWGNLRWACWACNQAKADMPPEQWEQRLPPRHPSARESRAAVRRRLLQHIATLQRALLTRPAGSCLKTD